MVRQRMSPRERPKRESRHPLGYLLAGLLCCAAHDCDAIEQVILEVGQLSTARVQAQGAILTLNVTPRPDMSSPTARLQVNHLQLGAPATTRAQVANTVPPAPGATDSRGPRRRMTEPGTTEPFASYSDLDVNCSDLLIGEPLFACNRGSIAARGGPMGPIAITAAAAYDSSNGAVSFDGSGLKFAGAITRFAGKLQSNTWYLTAAGTGLDLLSAGQLAQPWVRLPDGDTLSGHLSFELTATGQLTQTRGLGTTRIRLQTHTTDFNFSNQPGTTVAQKLTAAVTARATVEGDRLATDFELRSSAGQALAGAVLLDFDRNPLTLAARAVTDGTYVKLTQIQLHQTDLIEAQGAALIALNTPNGHRNPLTVEQAHFDIQRLEFAAAYRSFLQLTLATTDFGALNVGGRAVGDLDMRNDAVSSVNATLQNVSMADSSTKLSLANANGELHWAATTAPTRTTAATSAIPAAARVAPAATLAGAGATTVAPSRLSWSASSAYGLIGGPVQMTFTAQGDHVALMGDTRFPLFDGALVVHTLSIRHFGPDAELDFDAHLEPISMPLLSKAFGWPVLSGQLAGRVPGVTYRDHVLTVQGDLSANVFDGTIVGSRFRLSEPLGPWPRLDADVTARHLDLDLLTHTFSIGSISGRLDADIKRLELFNWAPVAFDARLQSTPGDRSEHRISQKAVTSISSVGGGGSGVTAALQSGVLQFFKTFRYDRIGISCQLRDEVCLMSGLEPAKNGYYLVKGRGLPRIDIIGNAGRVDWTQLVGQIAASMHSQNIIVR
jgi:hypothetical protein